MRALALRQAQIDYLATIMPLDEPVKAQDVKDELCRRFAITSKVTPKRVLELAVKVGMVEYQRTPAPYRSYIKRIGEAPRLKPKDNASLPSKHRANKARLAYPEPVAPEPKLAQALDRPPLLPDPHSFRGVTLADVDTLLASSHFLKRSADPADYLPVAEAIARMPIGGVQALGPLKEAIIEQTGLDKKAVDLVFAIYAHLKVLAYQNRERARSHIGRIADLPDPLPLLRALQERGHKVRVKPDEPTPPEPIAIEPAAPELPPVVQAPEPEAPAQPNPATNYQEALLPTPMAPSRDSIILKLLDDMDAVKAALAERERDLDSACRDWDAAEEKLREVTEDRDYKALEIEELKAEIARLKAPTPAPAGLSTAETKALMDRGYAHLLVPQAAPTPVMATPKTSETSDDPGEVIPFKVPRLLRPAVAEAIKTHDAEAIHEIVELIVDGIPEHQDQERALKVCMEILDDPSTGEIITNPVMVKGKRYTNLWKARAGMAYRILYMRVGDSVKFMEIGRRASIYGRGFSN